MSTTSDVASPAPRTRITPLRTGRNEFEKAIIDLVSGLRFWRVWTTIAFTDIRQRYQRSKFGQFWHTLLMIILIGSISLVYSQLFDIPIKAYVPYLAVTFPFWNLISGLVMDSTGVFVASGRYMYHVPLPLSSYIYGMITRSFIFFLHNLIALPLFFLIFGQPIPLTVLIVPLATLVILINGVWVGVLVGALCARFRDLAQIVGSLMQVAFFVTPVMYRPINLSDKFVNFLANNPFASFLAIVRDPFYGTLATSHDWAMVAKVTVIGYAVMLLVFVRSRRRIVFWI